MHNIMNRNAVLVLLLVMALPAVAEDVDLAVVQRIKAEAFDNSIELRVMTFNIEWGGDNISFDKVVEAIRRSEADIVGIQEAEGNLRRLASDLGWYYNERNYTISRFPLLEQLGAEGHYVLVEVQPGFVVALANTHLPSDPDGIAMIRDGATAAEVLAVERETRLPKIAPYLAKLEPLIEQNIPVFLTGDFNAPAHSDWTDEMVGARPFLLYSMDWPVSRAVVDSGFKDSWRDAHPDPKKEPGLTWWARRPPLASYALDENDPEERIDFVWYAGAADVMSSQIVGEKDMPGVSISVEPWPSDHRGVVSEFSVIPAEMPAIVAVKNRVLQVGEDIQILYRRAPDAKIYIESFGPKNDPAPLLANKVSGSGQLTISTEGFSPGHYRLTMSSANAESLSSEFWVLDKNAAAEVSVLSDSVAVNEAITISWRNGPGYRNDYLTVVEAGAAADDSGGVTWLYVNALPEGQLTLDVATAEWGWPVASGSYVVRLMKDDGGDVLAESAPFQVR